MTEKEIIKLLNPIQRRFTISFGENDTFTLKAKYGSLEVEFENMATQSKEDVFEKLLALQFSQGYRAGVDVGKQVIDYAD